MPAESERPDRADARGISDFAPVGAGRHGGSLPGRANFSETQRGRQSDAQRPRRRCQLPAAFQDRSAGGRVAEPSEYRAGAGYRRTGRDPVHRPGIRAGDEHARAAGAQRTTRAGAGAADHPPGRQCVTGGAHRRHRASRHQAREHHDHPQRGRESGRFRIGAVDPGRRAAQSDSGRRDDGNAAVHEPRTGGREECRSS